MTDEGTRFAEAIVELADRYPSDELSLVASKLEVHAAPCGREPVIEALAPLVTVFGVSDRSEREWASFWRFYVEALRDLPVEALRRGVADYVGRKDSEFFPKPGPLKAICERHAIPIRMAAVRARKAAQGSAA